MLSRTTASRLCHSCRSDLLLLFEEGFTLSRPAHRFTRSQARLPVRQLPQRSFATSLAQRNGDPSISQDAKQGTKDDFNAKLDGVEAEIEASTSTFVAEFAGLLGTPSASKGWEGAGEDDIQGDIHREIIARRANGVDPGSLAQLARESYGESLPRGILTEEEFASYRRFYGDPVNSAVQEYTEKDSAKEDDLENSAAQPRLFREDAGGTLEAVSDHTEDAQVPQPPSDIQLPDMTRAIDIAKELGAEVYEPLEEEEDQEDDPTVPRTHPLTMLGRFATNPSTVNLPSEAFVKPVQSILSSFSNKHLYEKSHEWFGMPGLPYSPSTPASRKGLPQKPTPLEASQHSMGEMEANAYLAAVMPQVYASVTSVLVEVRKRLGTGWIRDLLQQEGGPRVLDAGAGGAGILAWREIARAEWTSLQPDSHLSDTPLGKSTVLTGASSLRQRASALLENTTFLPRLPDYVHVRDSVTLEDGRPPPQRKQFDIIIAPHTLWPLKEEWMRKQHVQNLWSLLNPNGGVLVLLEKGVARGFEAIAGAREMLLERFISSPGSREYEDLLQSEGDGRYVTKDTGMIVAPCTNHEKCPMYLMPGRSSGRKDICSFEQRLLRPNFLQRILGASETNHEDVAFSYVAVQKGQDQRDSDGLVQGQAASDTAFEGYDVEETQVPSDFNALALPRAVWPPMKRRGHVILDLCTPAGRLERWTVPRSHGRQAYRDARKSSWGDLWALGAKTRVPRNVRIGDKKNLTQKERMVRKAEAIAEEMEEDRLEAALDAKEMTEGMEEMFHDWNEELSGRTSKPGRKAGERKPPKAFSDDGARNAELERLRGKLTSDKTRYSAFNRLEKLRGNATKGDSNEASPKWKLKLLKRKAVKEARRMNPDMSENTARRLIDAESDARM